VPRVDSVQDGLPHQMSADREHLEPLLLQQSPFLLAVVRFGQRLVHLEMIAPRGQFEPFEAEPARLDGQVRQRQICPLASHQSDQALHRRFSLSCSVRRQRTCPALPAGSRLNDFGSGGPCAAR
jgi:hypothetical protein